MRTILLLLVVILAASVCDAQWVQTGPYGGTINCFGVSGTNLFAGTGQRFAADGGVFVSTDNGRSWAFAGLVNRNVSALAVAGTSIFAGTSPRAAGDTSLFLSTDNGAHWIAVNNGLPQTVYIAKFAVRGTDIFAGTNYGVFLSTNNGNLWTEVNSGLTNLNVSSLAVSGTNLFAGTWGDGVFLSTNNGTSWIPVNSGLLDIAVLSLCVSGGNLFVGTNFGGVFRSTNDGTSWTWAGLDSTGVSAFAVLGTHLYAATGTSRSHIGWVGDGVFLSTDNGSTWDAVNNGLTNKVVLALAVSGTAILAGTVETGVFLSTTNGTSWANVNGGFAGFHTLALKQTGTHFFAGVYRYLGDHVFVSTDNGTHWEESGIAGPGGIRAFATMGTKIFAVSLESGVYASSDNGFTWILVWGGLSIAASGTDVFVGGDDRVWRSTDGGVSWNSVSVGLPENCAVYALFASGGNLLAGVTAWPGLGVYVSTNNGGNWTVTNLQNDQIFCFAGDETNLFAGGCNNMANSAYRSTDNGYSWTQIGLTPCVKALVLSGTNLFAGSSNGVFLSTNNGTSWAEVNSGLENLSINALEVSGTNLFAGTDGGVWSRPLWEMITSVEPVSSDLPCEFSLSQNYPNPFNPSTEIRYRIQEKGFVSLKVYDMLGREVATLVNELKQPGAYTVQFDGGGFGSGVYFYRMSAGSFVDVKKLLLLK